VVQLNQHAFSSTKFPRNLAFLQKEFATKLYIFSHEIGRDLSMVFDGGSTLCLPANLCSRPIAANGSARHLSCIIVTWWSGAGGIQASSEKPTGFLQCFDTVGLVI